MPIYEYVCASCNDRFDQLIRSQNPIEVKCPNCSGREVKRLVSSFATVGGLDDPMTPMQSSGGGCCGGFCGCGN